MSSVDGPADVSGKISRFFSFILLAIVLCLMCIVTACAWCGETAAMQWAHSNADPGAIVYTTDSGKNTVTIVDIANSAISGHLPGFNVPFRLAFSPDSRRAYIADAGSNSTIVIDTTTNTQIAQIPLDTSPLCIALSPDGSKAYVTAGSNKVLIVDTASCAQTGSITVGTLPWGICVNPVTGDVYVFNTWDKSVSIIKGSNVAATVRIDGGTDNGLAVTPDGSRLLVADGSSQVYVIDTANGSVLKTFSTGVNTYPRSIAFARDRHEVYVACSGVIKVFFTDTYELLREFPVSTPGKIVTGPTGNVIYALSSDDKLYALESMHGEVLSSVATTANDFAVARFTWNVLIPDPAPPTTTLDLAGPIDARGSYINEVRCTLTATDNSGGTGVKLTEYNLPGMGWIRYSCPFNVSTKGLITLLYRSADNADNLESTRASYFNVVSLQNAATPTPMPTPWPTLNLATASPVPSAAPDNVTGTTPTALPGYVSATPSAIPAATATPTPTPVPSAGFETAAAFISILCAGYALVVRKR